MSVLVDVQGLKKYFKTSNGDLHAVDDVTLSIEKGKTLGVVGESGCGKSTLGKVVIRLIEPTSGRVLFDGEDINLRKELALRKDMQIIFQDPFSSLNPRMTVSEIITEPLLIHHLTHSRQEMENRLTELMDTVGLAKRFANSYPHELDGGRRQRIGIARALSLKPKFIVCDEPVSALDVSIQAQILNLMQDLQDAHGLTYMFITHDLSVVRHISNDIMVMYLGNVVEKSEIEDLFTNTFHPYTKALLASIPEPVAHRTRERKIIKGEITSPVNPKPGCRFAARCESAQPICFSENVPLEEVLPNHFVACHFVRKINNLPS
jgi:peptide/nickel transport system ATP-binding protein